MKKIGFTATEVIGVGAYNARGVTRTTMHVHSPVLLCKQRIPYYDHSYLVSKLQYSGSVVFAVEHNDSFSPQVSTIGSVHPGVEPLEFVPIQESLLPLGTVAASLCYFTFLACQHRGAGDSKFEDYEDDPFWQAFIEETLILVPAAKTHSE